MHALTIQLTDQQDARLREIAEERGLDPPECARALLERMLETPDSRSPAGDGQPAAGQLPSEPERKPIWKRAVEAGLSIPPEERARLPQDGARNVDHYVYGTPRQE